MTTVDLASNYQIQWGLESIWKLVYRSLRPMIPRIYVVRFT